MSIQIQNLQNKIGATPDGAFGQQSLKLATKYFGLTNEQAAHFFGQTCEETGGFQVFSENLYYTAAQLMQIWFMFFNQANVAQYVGHPDKIANRAYANRMGNGDENSGDGFKFRGRGAIQLTGKAQYLNFSNKYPNAGIMNNPDLVATDYPFESAKFYFDNNNLWQYCTVVDDIHIKNLTKVVNGGYLNLDVRAAHTKQFYTLLNS